MKRILIVEDKKAEADAIKAVIHKVAPHVEVKHVDNVADAYRYAFSNQVTTFIVDIVLEPQKKNDASGLEFAEKIRKHSDYKYTPIVFITSLEDKRLYAYEDLHCYKYLRKPLFYHDVEEVIREVIDFGVVDKEDETVKVREDGIVYVINQKDIIYANSALSKMKIYTDRDCFEIFYMSCNELMKQLNPDFFIRCSRNTIVNIRKITSCSVKTSELTLRGTKEKIKIGSSFKDDVVKVIMRDD